MCGSLELGYSSKSLPTVSFFLLKFVKGILPIDDYAKDGAPGRFNLDVVLP